ncbi:hypothetical protein HDU87_002104 [Geranomyces variabilis]|uniref:Uncharacterized protein n=1 Tax=Geranomyces variabilis TaxID=109894 RepID=A0AAD5TMG3_9FUNG|nr:hypothetical protein HDU87_002104 [Geranomyces variabilis]
MWSATTSQDATAVDSTAGYDPVAAAAYYRTDWGAYQYGATADYSEAPPGVDYQPAEVENLNHSVQSDWVTPSQQYSESGTTEATAGVPEVSTVNAAEPETQSGVAAEATAPNSLESHQGSAAQYPDATTGYDYSAYAAGHYFDPNAAYNGMDGYQYGHGHHAYGQPNYYSAPYAAAAAAPKEIRNPFEDLAKPKEEKTEQAKPWPQRRGGPARKKIIMGLPKKTDVVRKTKSAAETTSVDSLISDEPSLSKSTDSSAVAEMVNSMTSEREVKPVHLVQMAAQEKENVEESDNNSTTREPAVLSIPLPMKLQSFPAPVQKMRISQAAESEDDEPLSDSERRKSPNGKGLQQRGDTAINAVRASTMTSSEISSRSAAAEALAAAKNAAANIMQREGFDRRASLTVYFTITLAFSIKISIAASIPKEVTDRNLPKT